MITEANPRRPSERTTGMSSLQHLSSRTAARAVLAATAVGAGLIHVAVAPEHLTEFPLLGLGFVLSAVAQLSWALAVLRGDSPRLLRIGAIGSLLFVGVYVVSRTVGLPLGPEAFHAEPLGTADLVCCGLELLTAAGALALAARSRALHVPLQARTAAAVTVLLLVITGSTGVALAAPPEHGHLPQCASQAGCQQGHQHDGHVG